MTYPKQAESGLMDVSKVVVLDCPFTPSHAEVRLIGDSRQNTK